MNRTVLIILVSIVAIKGVSPSLADVIDYHDFSDTSELDFLGSATTVIDHNMRVLRLTPSAPEQAGSAFLNHTIGVTEFSTAFRIRLSQPGGALDTTGQSGADGLTFTIQPFGAVLGLHGGGLGYQGITPSVAIEFDTYENFWDSGTNHIGINTNGDIASIAATPISPRLDNGEIWYAWVDYDGNVMDVRVSQSGIYPQTAQLSVPIDVAATIGTSQAYVGFTGATAAAFESIDVVSWTYHDHYIPEPACLTVFAMFGLVLRRRRSAA